MSAYTHRKLSCDKAEHPTHIFYKSRQKDGEPVAPSIQPSVSWVLQAKSESTVGAKRKERHVSVRATGCFGSPEEVSSLEGEEEKGG